MKGSLLLLGTLFFLSLVLTSMAQAETRTLRMYFTHTKESATITFKKNGRYVKSGLRKANRFLRDWRRKEPTRMDPALLDLVWEVYQQSGSRKPIHVISGYRSPRTNKMLRRRGRKVARKSQHTLGKALDFFMPDVSVSKLRALGLKAHRGGVGYYRGSFVHLDTGSVRHWPKMSRRQLARVFPRGKTIHVPSNGRPLKGYKIAKANLKRGLNADGSRRRTKVKKTLLARIFSGGGSRGDEGESAVIAKAKPVAKKPKPKPKKPVAVAAAKPKPVQPKKPTGPDPFSLENKAINTAAAKKKREDELKAKEEEKAKALAEAEAAAKETELASFVPKRVPVPRARPVAQTQLAALAPQETVPQETKLTPIQATEVALAAPPATTNILRPAAEVPQAASIAQPPQQTDAELQALKSRITTALARGRQPSPAEVAAAKLGNEQIVQALKALPVPKTAVRQTAAAEPNSSQVPLPKPSLTALAPDAAKQASAVEIAALSQSAAEAIKPTWRSKPVASKAEKKTPSLKVPIPTAKPAVKQPAPAVAAIATGAPVPMKSALVLGDLDGRSVKKWAVSLSTRVGPSAVLSAPKYKQSTKRAAPNSVYSAGFAFAKSPLRSDRFSGRALTRVAFAHFGATQ